MRLARVVLCLSLFLGACGREGNETASPQRRRPLPQSFETPTETSTPNATPRPGQVIPLTKADWVNGLPRLIVSRGSDVTRHRRGETETIGRVDGNVEIAIAGGAGTVIAQRNFDRNKRSELLLLRRSRQPERIDIGQARYVSLMDVGTIDGNRQVLYTTYYAGETETTGYLYTQESGSTRRERVTEASGPEFEITRASAGAGLIATSGWSDLTEFVQFFRPDGTEVKGRPSPTEKLPYGQPPYVSDAVLSGDGSSLAYLEGPDFDQQTQGQVGDWVLVVLDQTNGRERLRVKVAGGDDFCIPWLDFDGRWLVVSRAKWTRAKDGYNVCTPTAKTAMPAVVLDSSAEPALVEISGAIGVATIDD